MQCVNIQVMTKGRLNDIKTGVESKLNALGSLDQTIVHAVAAARSELNKLDPIIKSLAKFEETAKSLEQELEAQEIQMS